MLEKSLDPIANAEDRATIGIYLAQFEKDRCS